MKWSCLNSNKAPGPDGLNMECYKRLWSVIHKDLMEMIWAFFSSNSLPHGVNSSFIVLIPKKDSPQVVTDYRPISLINSSVKIILKILANRLGNVLPSLISEVQTGFVKGRNITENIVITNEVVHSIRSNKVKGMMIKLDFAKAFDSVKWSLLFQILHCLGFSERWIGWINAIFLSVRMSVLINGSPSNEFNSSRGLRQGDPLSPLLFNIVAELLNLLLGKAAQIGLIKGINLGSGPTITHQQYADDTIIFIENSSHSCKGIKIVLTLFEVLSGLSINYQKSSLYTSKADQSKASAWAFLDVE